MSSEIEATFAIETFEALDEATRAIAEVLDIEAVLQLIVDRVRTLADARYAALGIADSKGHMERFITSGITSEERARIGPPPEGHGLLALIIREGRSLRIPDIAAHPDSVGFPPNHPPMHSLLGVPILVHGRPVGDLYLTDKEGGADFDVADERLVELFARHAGIAIENARLHERVATLAVVEERDRIGRDLHDGIIQSLYAVGLSLEDLESMMTDHPAQAAARVDAAIDCDPRGDRRHPPVHPGPPTEPDRPPRPHRRARGPRRVPSAVDLHRPRVDRRRRPGVGAGSRRGHHDPAHPHHPRGAEQCLAPFEGDEIDGPGER